MTSAESSFLGVSFSRTDKSVRPFSREELDRELLDEGVHPLGYFGILGVTAAVSVGLLEAFRRAGFIGRQK